jgi:hypothetical protein
MTSGNNRKLELNVSLINILYPSGTPRQRKPTALTHKNQTRLELNDKFENFTFITHQMHLIVKYTS